MNRRRFIALIGAAIPGLWLDGTGLIQIPRKMVIAISGHCSFCEKKAKEVFGLAGIVGRSARICNECVDICLEILFDDGNTNPPPPPPPDNFLSAKNREAFDFQMFGLARNSAVPRTKAELEAFLADLGKLLKQTETDPPLLSRKTLACSFCDRDQKEVKKLIAGPQSYICDLCIGDAVALISLHS